MGLAYYDSKQMMRMLLEMKTKLNSLQSKVLRLLEEAGAEDLAVIVNTLSSSLTGLDSDSKLDTIGGNLHLLAKYKLIYFEVQPNQWGSTHRLYYHTDKSLVLSILDLRSNFLLDDCHSFFKWHSPLKNRERVEVVLAERGWETIKK